jgi:hypothetical protein
VVVDSVDDCGFNFWFNFNFGTNHPSRSAYLYYFLMFGIIKKILKKIGDAIATVMGLLFYFLIFSPLVFPIRLFTDFLRKREKISNFIPKQKHYESFDKFKYEG